MEEKRESEAIDMQRKHEKEVQFLMAQLHQVSESRAHNEK